MTSTIYLFFVRSHDRLPCAVIKGAEGLSANSGAYPYILLQQLKATNLETHDLQEIRHLLDLILSKK